MLTWKRNQNGFFLSGSSYTASLVLEPNPVLSIGFDGKDLFAVPLISCLDTVDAKETFSGFHLRELNDGEAAAVVLDGDSSIWTRHTAFWTFEADRISFRHEVLGNHNPGRCWFFSTGAPTTYSPGDSMGYSMNLRVNTPWYRSFAPNLANVVAFGTAQSSFVGYSASEQQSNRGQGLSHDSVFSPPPLCYSFFDGETNGLIGIGTEPDGYRFNGLEFTGCQKDGAGLYVNYLGYTENRSLFRAPEALICFGYSSYDCLKQYVTWLDAKGFSTFRSSPNPDWHREPVFCGWAEQTSTQRISGVSASSLCTQENYEKWISVLEERGIPVGTIVIDDKWQKSYGTMEIDHEKWPDMPGFVSAQHAKGRHVLLWIPALHPEGVPESLCVRDENRRCLFGDCGTPGYDRFLENGVRRLILETDIDGFKEDWLFHSVSVPNLNGYGALHGIELIRGFQKTVYNTLHKCKPDGLLETQTPNPLFRDCSDVLRLNDIFFATRNVPEMMRDRARIARLAGWNLLDCDNASSTTLEQWFRYAQLQVKLGTPSLYFLNETESFHEQIPDSMIAYLRSLWEQYREEQGLSLN
ncbi:MAG: hypothetical protein J5938_00225 [Clostridia bacterium]|nr:hypothetical protein [Clostridia bacterium]